MTSSLSIILPTYNERENICEMIDYLRKDFDLAEIIVVDDNSPDGTWQLVKSKAANDSHIKLIRRSGKRNLVSSLREGICIASWDVIVWLDCDFSMPPEIISKLVEAIDNHYDIAVGSRYIKEGDDARDSIRRVLASRLINKFAKWLLRSSIYDLTSGFIASRKHVFRSIILDGCYGEYCIDFILRAERAGFKIKEIPYVCIPRLKGKTKTASNSLVFMAKGSNYVIKIISLINAKLNDGY